MSKKDWSIVFIPLFAVIFLDHITKYYVQLHNFRFQWNFFYITLYFNKGAMLGLFSDLPPILRIVSLSTGGAFLFFTYVILQYLLPFRSLILRAGMSILMGGILGNVIDRILYGHVVDFLYLNFNTIHTGVFNVADFVQWIGYFMIVYVLFKDGDLLWPKNNARKFQWVNVSFQLRYCFILSFAGLGFSLIAGVLSYTFLRFVVIDLVGDNASDLNRFLIPFIYTFAIVSVTFSAILFLIGKFLSHRIAGPVYAFERFVNDFIDGKQVKLKLREGDDFRHLEILSEQIRESLTRNPSVTDAVNILPKGTSTVMPQHPVDEKTTKLTAS